MNPEHSGLYEATLGFKPTPELLADEKDALVGMPPEPPISSVCARAVGLGAYELRHDRPRGAGLGGVVLGCYTLALDKRLTNAGYVAGSFEYRLLDYLVGIVVDDFLERELEAMNTKGTTTTTPAAPAGSIPNEPEESSGAGSG